VPEEAPVSHICQAYPDRVEVRGRDLAGELMGKVSFTEYFHLLLTGREPTDDQRFFLDLLLVGIAEHGMMPSVVAARMTLAADPESLQGAVAAGILGCGPVLLGTSGACARILEEARGKGGDPAAVAEEMARAIHDGGGKIPGFGHPVHKPLDPRAERILELADAHGISGPHVLLTLAFLYSWPRGGSRCHERAMPIAAALPTWVRTVTVKSIPLPRAPPASWRTRRGAGAAGRVRHGGRRSRRTCEATRGDA
jgi:citrate synthase